MVIVTVAAREHLKETVLPQIEAPGVTVRLARKEPDQLMLVPDIKKTGDEVVEHDGTAVLLVDAKLANQLSGLEIDHEETPAGWQLTVRQATD